MQSSADVEAKNRRTVTESKGGEMVYQYNVDGFAAYLSANKALGVLLFWKEAEEYTMLFGDDERKNTAKKIYSRYIKVGSEHEVTGVSAEIKKNIESNLSEAPDDLFDELQVEVYSTMLLELFPNFYDACMKGPDASGSSESKIKESTTLKDVLGTPDFEIHKFSDYCRTIHCEDPVIFLLEVGEYRLLFSPSDLVSQAQKIYATYLNVDSETRIACSDTEAGKVAKTLETATATEALPLDLFDKLYDEVFNTLNMDQWPAYKELVLSGKINEMKEQSLADTSGGADVDMTKPSKAAVAAALRDPEQLEKFRAAAAAQGVKENIDFCIACQQYSLLFSNDDRKPKGDAIWKKHLNAGCDAPVNLPDLMIKKMRPKIEAAEPDAFDAGYQEMLKIVSDNLFAHYLREVQKAEERKAEEAAQAPAPAALPKTGGGCCVVQ